MSAAPTGRAPAFIFPDNPAALATARELGASGIRCLVLGHRPGPASHSRHAEFLPAPDFYKDAPRWAEFIYRVAGAQGASPVLFPTEDAALLVADAHHARLSERLVYPYKAPGVVPKILDKRRLYQAAVRAGVATPTFHSFEKGDDPAPLEALTDLDGWITKPACRYWPGDDGHMRTFLSLTGGSKAMTGSAIDAAHRIADAGFPVVVQENIPGPFEELVSVGLQIDDDGEVLGSFCARKRCEYPVPFGDGLIVETIADPGIVEPAVALLRELGYAGICDVEFKRDARDGQFKILDANPRVWLWHGLAARNGFPLALNAYLRATEEPNVRSAKEIAPRWVSPRGALAYLALAFRPGSNGFGLTLAAELLGGATATVLSDWRRFRDPAPARPSAWMEFLRAAGHRLRRD
jgi:predicted ATP-grasp superfamily ATP-dependent carboligase